MIRQALTYLQDWKTRKTRKPLIVRGARQVGKSSLVQMFGAAEFDSMVELNLEYDPADASLFASRSPQETVAQLEAKYQTQIRPGKSLLFLDEIQAAPEVLPALRYFREKLPSLHIIAAGSLLDFALKDHSFSMPVGRIEYLHIGPMTFEEFLLALGRERLLAFLEAYQLGQDVPLHDELIRLVRQYWIVGGMPESVKTYSTSGSYQECERIKQTILSTYRDDFGKYAGRIDRMLLGKVFSQVPKMVGRKFVYGHIDPDLRSPRIKTAFEHLCLARVAHRVRHSDAGGVPLGAEASERNFKALFLDVGLLCRVCGLGIGELEHAPDITLINSGAVAEQFVGQHLLHAGQPYEDPELHCWMRQKSSSNAEVDYLMTIGTTIIPTEVKAGKTGTLRSLHLFIDKKSPDFALRFNAAPPSLGDLRTSIAGGRRRRFRLLSLPFYLIGQAKRLCLEAIEG